MVPIQSCAFQSGSVARLKYYIFPGQWISRSGPIAWITQSSDLSCLTFLMGSYEKVHLWYSYRFEWGSEIVAGAAVVFQWMWRTSHPLKINMTPAKPVGKKCMWYSPYIDTYNSPCFCTFLRRGVARDLVCIGLRQFANWGGGGHWDHESSFNDQKWYSAIYISFLGRGTPLILTFLSPTRILWLLWHFCVSFFWDGNCYHIAVCRFSYEHALYNNFFFLICPIILTVLSKSSNITRIILHSI